MLIIINKIYISSKQIESFEPVENNIIITMSSGKIHTLECNSENEWTIENFSELMSRVL